MIDLQRNDEACRPPTFLPDYGFPLLESLWPVNSTAVEKAAVVVRLLQIALDTEC